MDDESAERPGAVRPEVFWGAVLATVEADEVEEGHPVTAEVPVVDALPAPEAPDATPWPDLRGATGTLALLTLLVVLVLVAAVATQRMGGPECPPDDGRIGLFDAEEEFAGAEVEQECRPG